MNRVFFILIYFRSSIFSCNQSKSIKIKDAIRFLNNNDYFFLGVRTLEGHKEPMPNTSCIPLRVIDACIADLEKYRNKKIIVYYRSDNRSKTAAKILSRNRFNAYNMNGSINECRGELIIN